MPHAQVNTQTLIQKINAFTVKQKLHKCGEILSNRHLKWIGPCLFECIQWYFCVPTCLLKRICCCRYIKKKSLFSPRESTQKLKQIINCQLKEFLFVFCQIFYRKKVELLQNNRNNNNMMYQKANNTLINIRMYMVVTV